MVESYATINFKLGDKSLWRKASILSDSVLSIVTTNPDKLSGKVSSEMNELRRFQKIVFRIFESDLKITC